MQHKDAAQTYVNLLACALSGLTEYTEAELSMSTAADQYSDIFEFVRKQFEDAKASDVSELFGMINALLCKMNDEDKTSKVIYAEAIALCMDKLIDYTDRQDIWANGHFCLFSMVPVQNDRPLIFKGPLNDNWRINGVCVIPKFPVSKAETSIDAIKRARPLNGRNMLYGINGELINIGYYPWDDNTPNVHHVVLSDRVLHNSENIPCKTCIAFSPISSGTDFLKIEKKSNVRIDSFICTGIFLNGINNADSLDKRYSASWEKACEASPDVFFAPEMIATDEMVEIENGGSTYLKPLLKKLAMAGLCPPRLTVMPTHWRNGTNRLLLFDETGRYLGEQMKRKPYVDQKNHCAEALIIPPKNTDVLLIHLKNQQRIAFAICSEYLIGNEDYVSNFLCKKLGVTLILVPSYSKGEQDFITAISAVKKYGTSVVWGNCCGAVPSKDGESAERIIGAASYAGTDVTKRFGEKKNCNLSCAETKYCVFCVEFPVHISQEKPRSMQMPEIEHLCK